MHWHASNSQNFVKYMQCFAVVISTAFELNYTAEFLTTQSGQSRRHILLHYVLTVFQPLKGVFYFISRINHSHSLNCQSLFGFLHSFFISYQIVVSVISLHCASRALSENSSRYDVMLCVTETVTTEDSVIFSVIKHGMNPFRL